MLSVIAATAMLANVVGYEINGYYPPDQWEARGRTSIRLSGPYDRRDLCLIQLLATQARPQLRLQCDAILDWRVK